MMITYLKRASFAGALFILLFSPRAHGQLTAPVSWSYRYEHRSKNEIDFYMTATLGAGWHLYSQYMEEGGPAPTKIIFTAGKEFVLISKAKEVGEKKEFFDDIYGMNVAWYSGSVSFVQRIRLLKPDVLIEGYIEFMTCNNSVCVPNRKEFRLHTP